MRLNPFHPRGVRVHGDTGTWGSIISWLWRLRCGGGGSESAKDEVIVDEGVNCMPRMLSRLLHVA